MTSRTRSLLLWASLIVTLLAFLEIASGLYYYLLVPAQSREMLEPLLGLGAQESQNILRYRPHPYFNYVFNDEFRYADGGTPYNSRGFRAPEWTPKEPGTIRIVAVGASTTYGIFSRDGKNIWPDFLQRQLAAAGSSPIQIVNLGVTGHTSFEVMGVVSMIVPELEPDVILINVGVNDAFAAGYPDEGGSDNTNFRFSWNVEPLPGPAKIGMRVSHTLRVAGLLAMSMDRYLPGDLMNGIQYPRPDDDAAARSAAKASGRYFRRNLRTIVALSKATDARTILVTQPMNPRWETVDSPYYKGVVTAHHRNNEIIREAGEAAGVPVIDLFGQMREESLFVDAIHANLNGERRVAAVLYPALRPLVAELEKESSRP